MARKKNNDNALAVHDLGGDAEQIVKRTIKDSVFTDFFRIPEHLFEMYKVLHPEDGNAVISDIRDITVENVLVDDIYNDLGFRVGDQPIILVEAQSTWSVNIIIRALIYLVKTYKDYIDDNGLDIYSSTKIRLPKPELYVLYIGDRKTRPEEITLRNEFFPDEEDMTIDVKVKMLYGTDEDDVISQYVAFTKVYDEQRRLHGRTRKAIEETIRICKDRNVLREYLISREKEIVDMLMTLFDEEQIMKNHDANLTREVTRKVTQKVTREVTKENQINSVRNLMDSLELTAEQAMDALKIPASEQSNILKKI